MATLITLVKVLLTPVQDGFQIMIRYDLYYPSDCWTFFGHLLWGLERTCGNQAQDRSVYLGSRCLSDRRVSFSDHSNHVNQTSKSLPVRWDPPLYNEGARAGLSIIH